MLLLLLLCLLLLLRLEEEEKMVVVLCFCSAVVIVNLSSAWFLAFFALRIQQCGNQQKRREQANSRRHAVQFIASGELLYV